MKKRCFQTPGDRIECETKCCMHPTGIQILTLPPIDHEFCCRCGVVYDVCTERAEPDPVKHGPYYQPWGELRADETITLSESPIAILGANDTYKPAAGEEP